jgi:outer membrane protein assembly factor BamB
MFFRRHRFRASQLAWTGVLLVAATSLVVGVRRESAVGQQIQFQINPAQAPPDEDPYGVYLPTDRTLSRGVSRARERLQAGEYNEALAFLQQLLDRDEDVFVDDAAQPHRLHGLKAAARKLIAGLPAAGREMYELLHTAAARRQLDAALVSGNRAELAQLVRRYFLTAPGYEAALVLAQMELDRGHPLTAAHLYEQLLADPATAAEFEPQLSLLTAVSWQSAGRADSAAAVLRALAEKHAGAEVELARRKLRLPKVSDTDAELFAWLDENIGHAAANAAASSDWLTLRGDPSRNTQHRGGAPHLSARWQSRVVNDPRFENFLTARRQLAEQQGIVSIAAARPIATGNVVLMRTPQNVVALDWQTGKRIWETREEESSTREQYLAEFMAENNGDDIAVMSHPLEQRVWDDTLTMSLSSDGQRAFALSGMSLIEREQQSAWGVGPGFGGSFDFSAAPTNRLTAYELATEGKLAWEIDGAGAAGDLSGVFFLGAPLAVDGSLYVLAEIRSAIYLLALESSTGKLEWRQQLAGLEQGISLDPQRRQNAATPSYSAGILVCPTTAGIVVAVDVVRHEFAWVYRYSRQADSFANVRQGWQGRADVPVPRANNYWLDGSAVIADGKVLVTPPESAELHCLDLSSGKQLWKKPREKFLFLACVDHGNALLVGADCVFAVRLADGAPAWSKEVALPVGSLPNGLGYLSDGRYFLPLSSGQVIAVRTSDGLATAAIDAPSDVVVGNLICHRGSIISQSAMFLDKFEQIEVLRERAEAALAANPRDAAAIRDLAEMRRLEGALAEAVPMLKQAYEIDPSDLVTRDMLADALLEALAGDYVTYQSDLPLLRGIVDRPQQQIDLLRIDAQGLDAAGRRMEAFAAYLRLVDATAADLASLTINPQHTARSDNWVRAQLNALWSAASTSERDEITRQLDTRKLAWASPPTASDLRTRLAYFGGLPGTDDIRLQLIHVLLERTEPLDVEMELMRLERSPENQSQATAATLLTQWLLDQGRPEPSAAGAHTQAWPHGRTTAEDLPGTAANRRDITRRAQAEYQLGLRKLGLEQIGGPACGPSQWLIAQDGSRLIGRDAAGLDVFRFNASRRSAMQRFVGNSDLVQAAQLGDLLYVTLGGQVVAIDSRQRGENGESDVIWQSSQVARLPTSAPLAGRRNGQSIYHPWSQRKRVPGAAGGLIASLGPATPSGVVFQDRQLLRCVDPLHGETLWSRNDVPVGCELFGDDEFVLAADPAESTVYVIRMSDGELVERRALPETPWLLTAGRNVAQLVDSKDSQRPRKALRIVDAVSDDKLFEADYDPAVRMTTLEPNYIAVVEPGGRFLLIDVCSGDPLIDETLPLSAPPRSIVTFRSGDQLFLGVNGPARQQSSRLIGLDYPLVDGQVFAFDLRDGRTMWPGPAVIDARGIALTQPADIPVLVFVDRLLKRNSSGSGTKLRLLCLDKATGATVYRNDELPDTTGGQFRVRATRGETATVDVEMPAKTIRLTFSERPHSPEPPANDLVEAPRKSLGRGLWGVTRRMGSALQDVIQKSGGTNRGTDAANELGGGVDELLDDD